MDAGEAASVAVTYMVRVDGEDQEVTLIRSKRTKKTDLNSKDGITSDGHRPV